jgi:hypothetical protein
VLDPADGVPEVVLEQTGGRGADIVMTDASGAAPALNAAIRSVGVDGLAIDWARGFAWLEEQGYRGQIGLEYEPLASTADSLAALRRFLP